MGLAASQARFLGITMRKANCEFKSTELAQQRLELTNQMTDIAQEYSNALNSTRLVWENDAVDGTFGLSYSLLMMPQAANDFNPYMVTTKTGAVVLSEKYAAAAKAAGISMGGGMASPEGRKLFLQELAADNSNGSNIITQHTYDVLEGSALKMKNGEGVYADVSWHATAGMGAVPKNKGVADAATLTDLILDKDIGGQTLDWLQIYVAALGMDPNTVSTESSSGTSDSIYKSAISKAKLDYMNKTGSTLQEATNVVNAANTALGDGLKYNSAGYYEPKSSLTGPMLKFQQLEQKIAIETNAAKRIQFTTELEYLKQGKDGSGTDLTNNYEYPIYWAIYEQAKSKVAAGSTIKWKETSGYDADGISIDYLFNAKESGASGDLNHIAGGANGSHKGYDIDNVSGVPKNEDLENHVMNTLTLCVNDCITYDATSIKNMTLGDLLSENVVLMAQTKDGAKVDGEDKTNAINSIYVAAKAMMTSIAGVFGYGRIGVGINTDATSDEALKKAFEMVEKKFLNRNNAIKNGSGDNDDSLRDNSAYNNANNFNRIGVMTDGNETYAGINLSNMVSAFLTYYDNFLRGSQSEYVVGKANDESESSKTYFVTDDPNYVYITNTSGGVTNDEKVADFYNQLYNNICEHGWRNDDMVIDNDYLESAVKDGRYSLMALSGDGYFYQTRYNDINYLVEETDKDAITRAETEYTRKKAELTYKEDSIDYKTKKLDAEIAELNTELNSVQNLISKAIEKTFAMFSN